MGTGKIVIDTNAFIQGHVTPAMAASGRLYTIPEVLSIELKDDKVRNHLGPLKGLIQVRSPDQDCYAYTVAFSKKTGDFSVLSLVDLKVIALVVTLEKEHKGTLEHLRTEPRPILTQVGKRRDVDHVMASAGQPGEDTTSLIHPGEEALPSNDPNSLPTSDTPPEEDSDGEGWITPRNLRAQRTPACLSTSIPCTPVASVACMTSDFAMQNVLLQMGLTLLSSDGTRIDRLKHWILRCYACAQLVHDLQKRFCPACGNPSLLRTSVSVNAHTGELKVHLKPNFQYRLRGTKYAIPLPKGGRQKGPRSGDLILREDQKEFIRQQKSYERTLSKTQMDPDALPSLLMSASMREKQSVQLHPPTIGHGRKNVNQVRRHA